MSNQERFFADEYVAETIKLSEEEVKAFEHYEYIVLCANGLKQISGGYVNISVYDIENKETDNEILLCEIECGVNEEGHTESEKWTVKFNRKTLKFIEE